MWYLLSPFFIVTLSRIGAHVYVSAMLNLKLARFLPLCPCFFRPTSGLGRFFNISVPFGQHRYRHLSPSPGFTSAQLSSSWIVGYLCSLVKLRTPYDLYRPSMTYSVIIITVKPVDTNMTARTDGPTLLLEFFFR